MLQRYARLWPMFFVGASIGLAGALASYALHHSTLTLSEIMAAGVSGILMLPSITTMDSISDLYPFDHPGWSIFYEMLINLTYYLIWRWLPPRTVVMVVVVSGASLLALHVLGNGFAGPSWFNAGAGIPRVSFSFFVGVLLGRRQVAVFKTSAIAWLAPAVTVAALYSFPFNSSAGLGISARIFDATMVFIGFPLLVSLSASVEPRRSTGFVWLGAISYPLYAIHEPVIFFAWSASQALKMPATNIAPWSGLVLAALVTAPCAWLAQRYEKPTEKILRRVFSGITS